MSRSHCVYHLYRIFFLLITIVKMCDDEDLGCSVKEYLINSFSTLTRKDLKERVYMMARGLNFQTITCEKSLS